MSALDSSLLARVAELESKANRLRRFILPEPVVIKLPLAKFPTSSKGWHELIDTTSTRPEKRKSGIYIFRVPKLEAPRVFFELSQYRSRQLRMPLNSRRSTPNPNPDHLSGNDVMYVGKRDQGKLTRRLCEHFGDPSSRTGTLRLAQWMTPRYPKMPVQLEIYLIRDEDLELIGELEKAIWTKLRPFFGEL
jgi:hypothetical protein